MYNDYRIRPLHKINIVNIRGHLLYSTKGLDKNETSCSVTLKVGNVHKVLIEALS